MTSSKSRPEVTSEYGPAYYARPRHLKSRVLVDWWTILHPPYTLWHLSYVVLGACLLAPVNATVLVATLLAFFLAVGIGAHALDELHGRPLQTRISKRALIIASVVSLTGASAIGVAGLYVVGPVLAVFIVIGVVLVVGYNLELFGGRLHSDAVFALGWGSFPVLTAYFAQHHRLSLASVCMAAFAYLLSRAQRQLSTPARRMRRHVDAVDGTLTHDDGTVTPIGRRTLLEPLEVALSSLSWAIVVLAVTLAIAQFHVA